MPPRQTAALLLALVASAAGAEPASVEALRFEGESVRFSLTLDSASFLAHPGACAAPEEAQSTLRVAGLDAEPTRAPIEGLPFVPHPKLQLSPTRALAHHAGADGHLGTADDGILLLDDLDGSSQAVEIPFASGVFLADRWERLDEATAVLGGYRGAFLLADLGGENQVVPLEIDAELTSRGPLVLAPDSFLVPAFDTTSRLETVFHFRVGEEGVAERALPISGRTHGGLIVLSPTRFLMLGMGPDEVQPSSDDVVHVFSDLDGSPTYTQLPAPFLPDDEVAILGPDRAMLRSTGPDESFGTADDQVLVLDHLGSVPTVTPLPVPRLKLQSFVVTAEPPGRAVVAVSGEAPAADALAVLEESGGSFSVTRVAVGPLSEGRASEPVRVGPGAVALASPGADGSWPSADDEVVTLSDVGGKNRVERAAIGGITAGTPVFGNRPRVLAVGPWSAAVATTGLDGSAWTEDDAFALVTGIGFALAVQPLALPYAGAESMRLLGGGRALVDAWLPPASGGPCNDTYLVSGLGQALRAREIRLLFGRGRHGARIRATADLALPEPERFARSDLTLRIGNASQTLPATALLPTETGYLYSDPAGLHGFLRRVEYDAAAGLLTIEGRGTRTGAASTRPRHLVLSLDSADVSLAHTVRGKRRPNGIVYRAR